MSFRTAYGYTHSENGWRIVNRDECSIVNIPNLYLTDTAPIRNGSPLIILGAWLYWYDRNVEEITTPVWGWSAENLVKNSNHLSGTAIDVCAPKYPWGQRTMPAAKIRKVREGLKLFEGSVFWGADWSRADEMHYQMAWPENDARNASFMQKLLNGHLNIYKTSGSTNTNAQASTSLTLKTLRAAMQDTYVSDATLASYLDPFTEAMRAADITTVRRAAAWCSQIGHESAGLRYMAEIQTSDPSWSADRTRYRGRGPIQLTWSSNYRRFGEWCKARGYVADAEIFVKTPELVEQPRWGFLAASWYWLHSGPRPGQINKFADAGSIIDVSRCVNGWVTTPNGMPDRIARWNRCLALGNQLLPKDGVLMGLTDAQQLELLALTKSNAAEIAWIKAQLGPNVWGPDSSLGKDAQDRELTLRDGLAAFIRWAKGGKQP